MIIETEASLQENPILETNRKKALANLERAFQAPEETPLREHQIGMIQALFEFFAARKRAGYLSEPTGVGKSAVMVKVAEATGLKTVILSPTQQILDQNYEAAKRFTPDLDITNFDSRNKDLSGQVVNTTYQSVTGLLAKGKRRSREGNEFKPDEVELVLCDEAHLGLGEVRHAIYRDFPNALLVGLTATAEFTQLESFIQRGLVKEEEDWTGLFRNLIHEMTLEEAIDRGILTNLDVHMVQTNVKVSDIQVLSSGEYSQSDLDRYFNQKARNALISAMVARPQAVSGVSMTSAQLQEIANIHDQIEGKRTAVYCISIQHADELAAELQLRGIAAVAMHSKVDPEVRRQIVKDVRSGKIQVLLGVDMIRLGLDIPELEVGIHARPTRSGVVKVQELGRVLRPSPESGKEKAIAIELVDQMERRLQSPVLIANIFDPEYVLRGTVTGKEPGKATNGQRRDKPMVSFAGMNIEAVVEEARSQELLRTRFKQANITEMVSQLDKIAAEVQQENPGVSIYEWAQRIAEALPGKVPMEAYMTALQAVASIDSNTRRLGQRALFMLNLKTILTIVDSYALGLEDDYEERDELLHTAVASIGDIFNKIGSNYRVSQQVNRQIRDAIAGYVANRDGVSLALARSSKYPELSLLVNNILNSGEVFYDQEAIKALAADLSRETEIPGADIVELLRVRTQRIELTEEDHPLEDEEEAVINPVITLRLSEGLNEVLALLTARERQVVKMRYALNERKKHTRREIGEILGVGEARVGQIEASALRKLRQPSISKRLISYIHPDDTPLRSVKIQKEPERELPQYDLSLLDLSSKTISLLRFSGIRQIGDFFSASPEEILEEWGGSPDRLNIAVKKVIDRTLSLYTKSVNQKLPGSLKELKLLRHVSDAAVYRDATRALATLTPLERATIAASPEEREKLQDISTFERGQIEIRARQRILAEAVKGLADILDKDRVFFGLESRIGDEIDLTQKQLEYGVFETKKFLLSRGVSLRAANALYRSNIKLGCLVEFEEYELLLLRNFGNASLFEVKRALSQESTDKTE